MPSYGMTHLPRIADVESTSASDTPSVPQLPRPRIVFKLGPSPDSANTVPAESNTVPPAPCNTTASATNPSAQGLGTMPADSVPRNLRLENARAAIEKKRKPDDKLPSASTKKQKISPDALAVPSEDKNTIRWVSVCIQIRY